MPETENLVTLGLDVASARTFYVRGPLNEGPIADFAAQVRIGEASYDARQGAGFIVLETFHGGGGILEAKVREDLGRWAWNSGAYTGVANIVTRPLATDQGTIPAFALSTYVGRGWLRAHQVQLGTLAPTWHTVKALGSKLIEINGPGLGWTDITPGGTTGSFYHPTSFIPSVGASAGTPMVAVCTTTGVYMASSLVSPTWTSITLPGGTLARGVLGYGDALLILLSDGRVVYNNTGTDALVLDSGGVNPDVLWYIPPVSEWMGVFRAPWGDAAPYMLWGGHLWVMHFHARKFFPMPTPLTNILAYAPFEDGFVITNGHTVMQVVLSGDQSLIREMPIFPEQGAPPGEGWQVVALSESSDHRLFAQLLKGTNGWIWEWNGIGWNPYGVPATVGSIACGLAARDRSAPFSMPNSQQTIMWQFGTDAAFRVLGPQNSRNPLTDTSYVYSAAVGYVETPWLDMGFRELDGAIFEIWYGGALSSGASIAASYALDGSSSFTSLGTITNLTDPPRLRFSTPDPDGAIPGTEFRRIKFRITPQGSGASSPNALPLTIVYRKKPLERFGFTLTIDAAHMISHPANLTGWGATITMENIMDHMKTLWNNKPQLYFKFADRTPTRVAIATYTASHQEIRDTGVRRGRISLQLEEIVDGS